MRGHCEGERVLVADTVGESIRQSQDVQGEGGFREGSLY
jgi:hypothetical protein